MKFSWRSLNSWHHLSFWFVPKCVINGQQLQKKGYWKKIKCMIIFLVFEDRQLSHVHCKMTLKFNNYLLIYANCNTVLCGNHCFQNFPNKSETLWPLRKCKRKISTGKKRSWKGIHLLSLHDWKIIIIVIISCYVSSVIVWAIRWRMTKFG